MDYDIYDMYIKYLNVNGMVSEYHISGGQKYGRQKYYWSSKDSRNYSLGAYPFRTNAT